MGTRVASWITACAGVPAQALFTADCTGLAKAELFEPRGYAVPVLRIHRGRHREHALQHLADQLGEDTLMPAIRRHPGIAQFERFALGIVPAQLGRLDQHEPREPSGL